jgi:hypothetical protein
MALTYSVSDPSPLSRDPRFLLGYHNAELAERLAHISGHGEQTWREPNVPRSNSFLNQSRFSLVGDASVVGALVEVAQRLGLRIQIALVNPDSPQNDFVVIDVPMENPTSDGG